MECRLLASKFPYVTHFSSIPRSETRMDMDLFDMYDGQSEDFNVP